MEARSEFPRFIDGDVTVVVSTTKVYQLHSHILHRLSPALARLMDEYPGAKLTAAAKRDGRTAYHFELRKSPAQQGGFGTFVRIRVSDNGKILRESDPYSFFNASTFGRTDEQGRYWDWLFGSFYSIAPKFEDHNLATVLHSCMGLVDAAEVIDAIEQIRDHVDLALMRQDQVLWRSIAANPTAWTELGCRLHSPTIFREGAIHLVGQWQMMKEEERHELRPVIYELVERKWKELDMAKQAIDLRILGHYPSFLCRSHIDKPHRTSYSTDIYMWMAICFYRQWYAQAISEARNRVAIDGGFDFYNKLAKGGNAYLHHEDFRAFHQFFPMSSKACNVLEANMNVLKEDVKGFVKDLVRVRTRVRSTDYKVEWLTCAVIEKEDLPWEQESVARAAAEQLQVDAAMRLGLAHTASTPSPTSLGALDMPFAAFTGGVDDDLSNANFLAAANLTPPGAMGAVRPASTLNDMNVNQK